MHLKKLSVVSCFVFLNCSATWECACEDQEGCDTGDGAQINVCEDQLVGLYPVVLQGTMEDPLEMTVWFQEEPLVRYCGGVVAGSGSNEQWVVGLILDQVELTLAVPGMPPDQLRLVAWSTQDASSDPHDQADEDGLFWADTYTTAEEGVVGENTWSRADLPGETGTLQAYLVKD